MWPSRDFSIRLLSPSVERSAGIEIFGANWYTHLQMPVRTTTQSRRFDCPKCGPVIFRVQETETTDADGEHVSTTTDRVKGYGVCAVFKKSGGKDTDAVLQTCPVFVENFAAGLPKV